MPNQNECDHMLRFVVTHADKITINRRSATWEITEINDYGQQFNYCSDCGAKIDWDKIKEEVDGK